MATVKVNLAHARSINGTRLEAGASLATIELHDPCDLNKLKHALNRGYVDLELVEKKKPAARKPAAKPAQAPAEGPEQMRTDPKASSA